MIELNVHNIETFSSEHTKVRTNLESETNIQSKTNLESKKKDDQGLFVFIINKTWNPERKSNTEMKRER